MQFYLVVTYCLTTSLYLSIWGNWRCWRLSLLKDCRLYAPHSQIWPEYKLETASCFVITPPLNAFRWPLSKQLNAFRWPLSKPFNAFAASVRYFAPPFNGSSYPLEQIAQPLERFCNPLGIAYYPLEQNVRTLWKPLTIR